MPSRLRPTLRHARASHYRRAGGPWDLASLDVALTGVDGRDRVVDGSHRADAGAIDDKVAALAAALRARGVRRRAVVAWQLPNCLDALLLYRACWRLGAVAAPVHHLAGARDVEAALAQVDPVLVVGDAEVDELVAFGARRASPSDASPARPSDLAAVLFTSGSTGTPKAVLHTQRGFAYKAAVMRDVHGLGPGDAILMPAPLAHVSGLLNGVLVPGVTPGMKVVLMAKWDPDLALEIIERERITFMIGPPTFFVSLMSAPSFSPARVTSLRLVSSGGAGVTPAFVTSASEALNARVKRTYGSTEAPTVTTSSDRDPAERARDTDGRPTGEAELRVSDPATGRRLPPDAPGELWLRGPELFVGYADPAQTAATHHRGWFRTGDLATVSEDGWLTIVGRMKDVIIRGGENISAAEVEAVLESHPSVRQAVAVGYPDERLGERVAAYVVTTSAFDLDACRDWFESRGVTRFKTPEMVIAVDELPLLAAGKPDRAALRARLVEAPQAER